jgi:hypothetical protein
MIIQSIITIVEETEFGKDLSAEEMKQLIIRHMTKFAKEPAEYAKVFMKK